MENKSGKILNTVSDTYFYCKVNKDSDGIVKDLIVEESNYSNEDVTNKKFSEVILEVGEFNNIYNTIVKAIEKNENLDEDTIALKWTSNNYIVIWLKNNYIKENLRLKKELNNHEILLNTFIDSMPDYVFFKDIEGTYLNCNKKFYENLKMKKEDIIGKKDEDLYREKTAKKFKETDLETISNNGKLVYVDEVKLKENMHYVEETMKIPYLDQNNNVIGIIGVTRDISYKRAVEDRVRSNENIFLNLLNHLEDAVIIKEGEKTLFVNNAFEKIYGINPKEIYERKSFLIAEEHIHPEDRNLFDNIDFNEPLDKIARIIRKDNEVRWVWFRSNPFKDVKGKILRRIIIINDITNKMNKEKELDKLRREFFANLSHEFNTPINLILSVLKVLELSIYNEQIENKSKFLNYIESCNQNIFRMIKLTNNLIDSMKIEEKLFRYNPVNLEIVSFVEELCFRVGKFANEKSIEIIFDTEFEERLVYFDPEHLERIILNILSNAIKFNKENGKIDVLITSKDGMIEIKVNDTGIGISKDNLNNVFNRFKFINNRMTKISEGCGIGLYIAKALSKMHNGDLIINSELGVGTEAIIKLPDIISDNKSKLNKVGSENIDYSQLDRMKIEFSDIYI
ncbi:MULTISPECIES: sensor histidine kinase [Clostridium]|uniref:histidine kinase n=5 Tax=Clostridium TaxID=1485 RepID=A0ABP3WXT2_9CLOT|nr:PAS domain-containing sensor histidine kinase [Clostridium baratii]